jgi:phosphoribosylformylglycinamidine synthase
MKNKKAVSAYAIGFGGVIEAVSKMAFGNKLGVNIKTELNEDELFLPDYGSMIIEMNKEDSQSLSDYGFTSEDYDVVGEVTGDEVFRYGSETITIDEACSSWMDTLEKVYPTRTDKDVKQSEAKQLDAKQSVSNQFETRLYDAKKIYVAKNRVARPKVFIPVFPGTNSEYDTLKAFEAAGADVETVVFSNMNADNIRDSVDAFEKAINKSQILMFSGGFSAGDEPDGSGKFIATIFRNDKIKDAVSDLLNNRDGLALGICNGFQALIKLGLVPCGEIKPQKEDSPTLITNKLGRHVSKSVYTKVVSNASPWLMKAELGGIYTIPSSHGEGRFVASKEWIDRLFEAGQVATQYVDLNGNPTMDEDYNPNGAYCAIEGITSPDGRIFGKMTHSERIGDSVAINISGNQNQHIFESGVSYYRN